MASFAQVQQYLAYWFQLGKRVVQPHTQQTFLPSKVISGENYSQEFESICQLLLQANSPESYLEGTSETLASLLTSRWNLEPCHRCQMPIAINHQDIQPSLCPCHNLPTWPNTDLPTPREPLNHQHCLEKILQRLHQASTQQPDPASFHCSKTTHFHFQ